MYILAAIVAFVMTMFIAPEVMEGKSMEPTINDGDVVIMTKADYSAKRGIPDLGQLVIMEKTYSKKFADDNLFARVVGLPGDTVAISGGKLYRNGREYKVKGAEGDPGANMTLDVDKDSVFLLCDNREGTEKYDSRNKKMKGASMREIRGNVKIIVWPFSRFGGVD